jgi:coenzyme F420-dependent glucose-6-phosphate dehydrogenase
MINRRSSDEVYVHKVGRNQEEFIRAYGERVIPKLRWPG